GADAAEELFGELAGALRVDHADDRENQQALANLKRRSGELADGLLLLADGALAFLNESDGHSVGDAVGGGLVGVQDATQLAEIGLVFGEQRARQNVAQ